MKMNFYFLSYYVEDDEEDVKYLIDKTGGLINDFSGARPTT